MPWKPETPNGHEGLAKSRSDIPPYTDHETTEWMEIGLCRGRWEEFELPYGIKQGPKTRFIERAKGMCLACPVLLECTNYANQRTWSEVIIAGQFHPYQKGTS